MKTGKRNRPVSALIAVLATVLVLHIPLCAAARTGGGEDSTAAGTKIEESAWVQIENWLQLGPFASPFPAFHEEEENKIDAGYILSYEEIDLDGFKPAEGGKQALFSGRETVWKKSASDTNGVLIPGEPSFPQIAYLAAYVEAPRWMKIDVEARATHPFEIYVGGNSVVKCEKGGKDGRLQDKKTGSAKLETGKHLILVKTAYVPGDTIVDWRLDARIKAGKNQIDPPVLSLSPVRNLTLREITGVPYIRDVDVSPDGKLVALRMREITSPERTAENWLEIRRFRDGGLERTVRDVPSMTDVQWAPAGKLLSYKTSRNGKGTIRVLDLETGAALAVVENVKELDGYAWGPDASFIVYSVTKKPEKDETGAKKLRGIRDRTNYGRNRWFLYMSSFPGGITRKITAGRHSTSISDIHPDGRSMLLTRHYEDLSGRPYGVTELIRMNLEDHGTELLWKGAWLRGAGWSPDGGRILVTAGPSAFGETGKNVTEGRTPNDYDKQAYIFDPATKKAESLTRDFDPAVVSATWSKADGYIYLVVEEGSFVRLYRCDPKRRTFKRIDVDADVIGSNDIALDKSLAAFTGSSANRPPRLFSLELKSAKANMIFDPAGERFLHVRLGGVEDWNFTTGEGKTIEGRIYYPPGFDPQKKYPCLVYYYGGTSPISRSFGGRYPKNLWAAMGYIVYVLQPSGATGFGQEFSSVHVNDWGKVVAGEIIEGTKKFLDAHPFVDGGRVGCLGASYGGFMTQLLITKTDIFAAAVSHAGISSITSYWGEGYWGYAYNAVAAANSFPWNRPDIYIDQSPLFAADRINTPLLLLHGTDDTNVPPGESEQMYTALKLLGKEVEYVRFSGQNHFILDHKKRTIWSNTILAWFDRWLKDEPDWWNDLYPPPGMGAGDEESAAGSEPGELETHVVKKPDGSVTLFGEVTRDDINENLSEWDLDYWQYEPDEAIIGELIGLLDDVEIVCVLGTWCSDSRREVPRFWKILEQTGYPVSEMKMLAVGRSKAGPDEFTAAALIEWSKRTREYYDVTAVASIIIYRGGEEIGRIVESPVEALETDLLKILESGSG